MWIVVADERRAMLYLSGALREPFALLRTIENDGDAPDRELETDRPGRTFSSSTGQRHGVGGERSTRRTARGFARRIAEEIERAQSRPIRPSRAHVRRANVGLLREALPAPSREPRSRRVPKDMAKHDEPAIRAHVPQETWRELGR